MRRLNMFRRTHCASVVLLLLAGMPMVASAQKSPGQVNPPQSAQPTNSQQIVPPSPIAGPGRMPPTHLQQPGYPYLNAPMYPSPVPYVPPEIGSTTITNQALAPHEFLYPHAYKALYPPYYHYVKGKWVMTAQGVRYKEDWYLQGTEVDVKYRAHANPFTGFHIPFSGVSHKHGLGAFGWSTGGLFRDY